jgi:hypothetical protein
MTLAARLSLVLTLVLAFAAGVAAQESTATTGTGKTTAPAAATAEERGTEDHTYETRKLFNSVLRRSSTDLGTILVLEPTLLSNKDFLAGYPELEKFLAEHPEIRSNPRFYLAQFRDAGRQSHVIDKLLETMSIAAFLIFSLFAVLWLIRTIIEQRRWKQLARTQSETHNKILDRFSASSELLEYVKSPAGAKFLESAPIPLHGHKVQTAPLTRILWSLQLGVVVAIAGFGMLLVSFRFDGEPAQSLFAMGVIAFCIGAGFIASAAVSVVVSRRLGLWQGDPGAVR